MRPQVRLQPGVGGGGGWGGGWGGVPWGGTPTSPTGAPLCRVARPGSMAP